MPSLRATLDSLAAAFSNSVMQAIRGASLEELLEGGLQGGGSPVGGRGSRTQPLGPLPTMALKPPSRPARTTATGRLKRRSPEDIAKALDDVVVLVKKSQVGLRAEQIRTKLGVQSKEMPRILKEGLAKKKLKAKGQKRATTYSAV